MELDAPRDVLASRFSLFGISMTKGENVFYLGCAVGFAWVETQACTSFDLYACVPSLFGYLL